MVSTLHGCVICATGLSIEERLKISRLVGANGGSFTADLRSNCTHLLVGPMANSLSRRASPKLAYALKWNIPAVSLTWLEESLERRICLDSAPYKIDISHLSASQDGLTQNFLYEDLTAEEVGAIPLPPYLEGLYIYVGDQLSPGRLALLKKLILSAGGTRYSDLYDRTLITHYIVHNQTLTPRDQTQLELFADTPPTVVHDQWLFACFYAKERVNIGPYLVKLENVIEKEQQPTAPTTMIPIKSAMWSIKSTNTKKTFAAANVTGLTQLADQTTLSTQALPVFSGLKFKVLFNEEPIKIAQLTDLIESNGGSISTDEVDYIVGPIIGKTIALNELWLEACINQNRIVPEALSPFYSSLIITSQPELPNKFGSLRISITGYAGIEREYYARIITTLGATYTENLSRKNTHLIAASKNGPKYDFANSVNITIVSASWIIDSARAGFPVDCKVVEYSLDNEQNNIVDPIEPRENAKPALVNLKSSAPLACKRQVNEIETPIRLEVAKRVREVAEALPPLIADLYQDTQVESVPKISKNISKLLSGFIFAISQRLWHRREEMHDLVCEMGGIFVWSYDTSCTHYIHQGNMEEEMFREFRLVRQHGKWIVSPYWLLKSKEEGKKLPEVDFPHMFNPLCVTVNKEKECRNAMEKPFSAQQKQDSTLIGPIDFDSIIAAADRKSNRRTNMMIGYSHTLLTFPETPHLNEISNRVFAFSALTPDQRASFPNILSNFGAKALKSSTSWESGATHLIIGALSKSEKFLCACAAGLWVLRPEYIQACIDSSKLVDEQTYEWQPSWCNDELSRAPHHWREFRMRNNGKKAFESWTVLLAADQKRSPSLKAILEAGNATVCLLSDLKIDVQFSHVLISSTQMKAKIPTEFLERNLEKVRNVDLIADHLLNFDKS